MAEGDLKSIENHRESKHLRLEHAPVHPTPPENYWTTRTQGVAQGASKLTIQDKKRGVGIGGPNVIGTKTKEPQGILNKILRTAPVNTPRWASYGKP